MTSGVFDGRDDAEKIALMPSALVFTTSSCTSVPDSSNCGSKLGITEPTKIRPSRST